MAYGAGLVWENWKQNQWKSLEKRNPKLVTKHYKVSSIPEFWGRLSGIFGKANKLIFDETVILSFNPFFQNDEKGPNIIWKWAPQDF